MRHAEALAGELNLVSRTELADRREQATSRLVGEFERQAPLLSDEAIELYDVALRWLVADMERSALAALSEKLAGIPNAPAGVIRILAFNDDLAIAGPVLERSPRLSPGDLIAIIGEKGQEHILVIARRVDLTVPVTDELIVRGSADVLQTLAANGRAPLSADGRGIMIAKAGADHGLAIALAQRFHLPEALKDRLVTDAAAILQAHLAATHAPPAAIDDAVAEGLSGAAAAATRWMATGASDEPAAPEPAAGERPLTRDARFLQISRNGTLADAAEFLAPSVGLPTATVRSVLAGEDDFLVLMALRASGLAFPAVERAMQEREPDRALAMDAMRRKFHAISVEDAARRLSIVCRARGGLALVGPTETDSAHKSGDAAA